MTSLAEFIQSKRERAGYSIYGLADRAALSIEQLEDIESGRELFLPVTVRQKLARALKCSPNEIKKYEREYEFEVVSDEKIDEQYYEKLINKYNNREKECNKNKNLENKVYDLFGSFMNITKGKK